MNSQGVLASLQAAELDAAPTDIGSLEKGGERYWIFLEDWSEAFPSLIAKGLIDECLLRWGPRANRLPLESNEQGDSVLPVLDR